jgi:glycosyltransferase involved in cell wall biosynthesis
MTFSIVIPTFNGERYIESAINSALNQTKSFDEIIVSDDNSSDNTINICDKYKNQIKLFRNSKGPSGFVNAWLNAISHSTSDYITILHQDDLLSHNYLHHISAVIQKYPQIKHIYTPARYIGPHYNLKEKDSILDLNYTIYTGQEYAKKYLQGVYFGNHIHRCPGVTTERNLLTNYCTFRQEAGHIADDDFFLRVGQYTNVIGIHPSLAFYRIHPLSTTNQQLRLSLKLSIDWVFQLREFYNKKNPLLDQVDCKLLIEIATRDLTTSLVYALKNNDTYYLSEVYKLQSQINQLSGCKVSSVVKRINKRFLWYLVENKRYIFARILVSFITLMSNSFTNEK